MNKINLLKFGLAGLATAILLGVVGESQPGTYATFEHKVELVEGGTYVEDIVGYSPHLTGYDPLKVLEYQAAGYKVADGNFNQGGGDGKEVYLLYKTTTDENKALRKVSTIEMGGGYSEWDYESIVGNDDEGVLHNIQEFKEATKFYADRYNGGTEVAVLANKLMNFYFYPEKSTDKTGTKVGQWLLNSRSFEEYKRILLFSNAMIAGNIMTALTLSSIDNPDDLWMDRFVEELKDPMCDALEYEEEGDYQELINKYGPSLNILVDNFKNYKEGLEDVLRRSATGEVDYGGEFVSMEQTIKETIDQAGTEPSETSTDCLYLQCDAILRQYHVYNIGGRTANTTLADVILEMGSGDLQSAYGYLRALINALNPGQFFGLKNTGLETLMLYTAFSMPKDLSKLSDSELEIYNEYGTLDCLNKKIDETGKSIAEVYGTDCISIYEASNSDLLDMRVAQSSEAMRSNSALYELDELMVSDEEKEALMKALTTTGYVAGICAGVALAAFTVGHVLLKVGFKALVKTGVKVILRLAAATVRTVIGACIGVAGLAGIILCVVVAIVICIIMLINKYKEKKADIEKTYDPIPEVIIDRSLIKGESKYFRYDVVRNLCTDEPLDLNFQRVIDKSVYARRWQSLYFTKDKRIGAPIVVKDNKFITLSTDQSSTVTADQYPVCKFGNFSKANLNAYLENNSSTLYAHYYIKGTPIDPTFVNGKYVESVIIRCADNATAARNAITNEGYILIDKNLTPDTGYGMYMGFRTTDDSEQAVTDIRLAWNEVSDTIYWGDTTNSYGLGGAGSQDVNLKGSNGNHVSLYYTKSKGAGSPILSHINTDENSAPDGLVVTNNAWNIPEGYEGVNMFGGGRAWNFNVWNNQPNTTFGAEKVYVYFKPEVQYTSKNSKPYISGFGFFMGTTVKKVPLDNYFNQYNDSGFSPDKLGDLSFDDPFNGHWITTGRGDAKVKVSYTYNPYRAITDIGIITGQENNGYLPNNVIAQNVGYNSCVTYVQGDGDYFFNNGTKNVRLIRDSHCYANPFNKNEGPTGYDKWVICPKAMYVAGPRKGVAPLEPNSISVYAYKKDIPTSRPNLRSVHELKNKYFTEVVNGVEQEKAYNIGVCRYEYCDHREGFYMFYKSTPRVTPKYVAAVYAYESTVEKGDYNDVMFNLLSQGIDVMFENRTISKLKDDKDFDNQVFFHLTSDRAIWCNVDETDEWSRSGLKKHQDGVGFVGVKYTDKSSEAIGDVKLYYQSKLDYQKGGSKNPSDIMTMEVDGTGLTSSYTRSTGKITASNDLYMWIYTSKSGPKLTGVRLSDKKESVDQSVILPNQRVFTLNESLATNSEHQLSSNNIYLYCTREGSSYIKDMVYVCVSKLFTTIAIAELKMHGCTEFNVCKLDDNYDVLFGYIKTNSRAEAIKDFRMTFDENGYTTIGGYDYVQAKKLFPNIVGLKTDYKLSIYYTRGLTGQNKYAVTDVEFVLITGNSSINPARTGFVVGSPAGTLYHTSGEQIYNNGSESAGSLFTINFSEKEYGLYMNRVSAFDTWGSHGPAGRTASIFVDNPSLGVIIIILSVAIVGAAGVTVAHNYKKKKTAKEKQD